MKLVAVVIAVAAARGVVSAAGVDAVGELAADGVHAGWHAVTETRCDLDVELRGAIAVVTTHEVLAVPADRTAPAGGWFDFELPASAQLVGAGLGRDAAVAASTEHGVERVRDPRVLGADPLLVRALRVGGDTRPRYRALFGPIANGGELVVTLRWTAIAELDGGALHLVVPGRAPALARCRGHVRATPGPGATFAGLRVDGAATSRGAPFEIGDVDVALDIALAFAAAEPVVWTQTEALGDGYLARALTIAAPPARAGKPSARVIVVADTSRSMALIDAGLRDALYRAIGAGLPRGAELQGIGFDRVAAPLFDGWRAVDAATPAALADAIARRRGDNGSDLAGALAVAGRLATATSGPTSIVIVTDGALGGVSTATLAAALPAGADLSIHAIVIDPLATTAPDAAALRGLVARSGGSFVELEAAALAHADRDLTTWVEPGWLDLAISGSAVALPRALRPGSGVTRIELVRAAGTVTIIGSHDRARWRASARVAPAAPIAQLALARTDPTDFQREHSSAGPSAGDVAQAVNARAKLTARHPAVDAEHVLVVPATVGAAAHSRRDMLAKGGPFTYLAPSESLDGLLEAPSEVAAVQANSLVFLGKDDLQHMFELQLLRPARACYQRALVQAPKLAGKVELELELGRGEVVHARVASGLGDAALDACLVGAAYGLAPPVPNLAATGDPRAIARYPITFVVRDDRPDAVPGDADSSSPLDLDAVDRDCSSVRCAHAPVHVDPADVETPLGKLRPTPSP